MGPPRARLCQSSRPPPSAWASGHASSASEHVTDGVSGGRAAALPSSHTDWRPQCPPRRPRGPGCCSTRRTRRAAGCGGPSPVQPAEARKVSPPRREVGRWGRMPPPPAASVRGALSTPPGGGGSCYSVPNPVGHRAIYLDVGPARPQPPPCSPLQETPHFTPLLPPPVSGPEQPRVWGRGDG